MKFNFLKSGKSGKKEEKSERKGTIRIERTKNTPEVFYDRANNILKINGASYPEDATTVYFPILEWLNELDDNIPSFTCEFNFSFLSSSSHKMVYEILMKLEDFHAEGVDVHVSWYYEESDEDIMDAGEDFARILTVPIKMVEIEE